MRLEVHNRVSDFNSYRAARVKSLFNAESGCNFDLSVDADLSGDWNIGVIVGPSGSGKTSLGRVIFGDDLIHDYTQGWAADKPIVDCIAPDGDFNEVTGALASVGLGSVPSWLRPFRVLSNGEQFRAGLARVLCERPERIVIDEFTSVIDRQIAKVGSHAFQKCWRKMNPNGRAVLLTPHYDVLDWLQPDWVIDTKTGRYERSLLRRRPEINLEIFKTDYSFWKFFEPHHYLALPIPPAAECFVGTINGELACHIAVAPFFNARAYRAARIVVMPEWQGVGVGSRFINWVCQYHLEGNGRCGKRFPTLLNTSHPKLAAYFRRSPKWVQVSAALFGTNRAKSLESRIKSGKRLHKGGGLYTAPAGYGGHFRAIQGFKYIGERTA